MITRPAKHKDILNLLQKRIVEGEFTPGQRLPNRDDLQQIYGASRVTVQRALDRLMANGFAKATPGQGTFVSEYPPHQYQYGLLFRYQPRYWAPFHNRLRDAALIMQEKTMRRFKIYCGLDGHHDAEDYHQLVRDIHNHQLRGLIFLGVDPEEYIGTPVLEEPGIGRTALRMEKETPNVVYLNSDWASWVDRALDYLVSRDRRRIAVVGGHPTDNPTWDLLLQGIEKRKIFCPRHWIQKPDLDVSFTQNCVQLLMSSPAGERPDGLIVGLDFWKPGVVAGLVASGIRVPRDVEVVAHCNMPNPEPDILPLKYLGWDAREMFSLFIDALERQLTGSVETTINMPPRFKEELDPVEIPLH